MILRFEDEKELADHLADRPEVTIMAQEEHENPQARGIRHSKENNALLVEVPKLKGLTEEEFQQQIFDLAHLYHWRVAHFRPAMTKWGWRTAVSADGRGFPDTVLAKPGHPLILAELKSDKGQITPEQNQWAELLREVPGIQYFCWRPSDLESIINCLC